MQNKSCPTSCSSLVLLRLTKVKGLQHILGTFISTRSFTKLVKQAEREMWMNGSTDRENHNWLNQKSISTVESFV